MISGTKDEALLTALTYWLARADGKVLTVEEERQARRIIARLSSNHPNVPSDTKNTAHPITLNDICCDKSKLPKPTQNLTTILSPVRELFIAGGGGAGRSLPGAMTEAARFGLDFNKIEVVCATSVGTILGLGIVVGVPVHEMSKMLDDMPTDQFQDWSLSSIADFFQNWGVCEGKFMPSYFRKIIKKYSDLEDPTFEELYQKTGKEFRVIVANVSKKKMMILSHKTKPHMKVADGVGLSCSVPFLYPPMWLPSEQGDLDAYTDGGIIKNYPWGVGSDPNRPLEEQLGFIFVNNSAAYALNDDSDMKLAGLKDYLCNLLTMAIFQDPLCLSDSVKARTVAISLGWNPLKFTATPEEQKGLDKSGKQGTRRLIKQIIKSKYGLDINTIERLLDSDDVNVPPTRRELTPQFTDQKGTQLRKRPRSAKTPTVEPTKKRVPDRNTTRNRV